MQKSDTKFRTRDCIVRLLPWDLSIEDTQITSVKKGKSCNQ